LNKYSTALSAFQKAAFKAVITSSLSHCPIACTVSIAACCSGVKGSSWGTGAGGCGSWLSVVVGFCCARGLTGAGALF